MKLILEKLTYICTLKKKRLFRIRLLVKVLRHYNTYGYKNKQVKKGHDKCTVHIEVCVHRLNVSSIYKSASFAIRMQYYVSALISFGQSSREFFTKTYNIENIK